jgi:hypothetical protein
VSTDSLYHHWEAELVVNLEAGDREESAFHPLLVEESLGFDSAMVVVSSDLDHSNLQSQEMTNGS